MESQAKLATLEELVACSDDLKDPRSQNNRKHALVTVVAISLMAVLFEANGPASVRRWTKSLERQLPSLLSCGWNWAFLQQGVKGN